MPGAVLLLQMLLSSHAGDLHPITEVIGNDVGLTVRLLHLAGQQPGLRLRTLSVEELVVLIGLQPLRSLAESTTLLPTPSRQKMCLQPWERFWTHARLTARIAEGMSVPYSPVGQSAHVAGLLRHLGALPALLGWNLPDWDVSDPRETADRMAKAWHLPAMLTDVIRGDDKACGSGDSYALLVLADMADERARRWESIRSADTLMTAPVA